MRQPLNDLIEVLLIDDAAAASAPSPRVSRRMDIRYGNLGELRAILEDISRGGLAMTVADPLVLYEELEVTVPDTGGEQLLILRARVVHQRAVEHDGETVYRVGLEFANLRIETRRCLDGLLKTVLESIDGVTGEGELTHIASMALPLAKSDLPPAWKLEEEIERLKKERNAVILAHYYQESEIQDLADHVGDSLGLARAAQKTDADVIAFCGVHFMAEVAKILNPQTTVVLPDLAAGCSLADGCPPDQFRALPRRSTRATPSSATSTARPRSKRCRT